MTDLESQLTFFCKLTWCGIFFPPAFIIYTSVLHEKNLRVQAAKFRLP